jgi:hypothetical protein
MCCIPDSYVLCDEPAQQLTACDCAGHKLLTSLARSDASDVSGIRFASYLPHSAGAQPG